MPPRLWYLLWECVNSQTNQRETFDEVFEIFPDNCASDQARIICIDKHYDITRILDSEDYERYRLRPPI